MSIQNMNENMDIIQSLVIPGIDFDMDIIQKLDDEPNDVGGLTAAELKAEFDKAGNLIKSYINETLLPSISDTVAEEYERSKAEETRIANENNRVSAENLRAQAESIRVENEQARVQAEAARVAAELLRVQEENLRASAENARNTAETAREEAEARRESTTNGIVVRATEQAEAAERSATHASNFEQEAAGYSRSAAESAASASQSASNAAQSAQGAGNSAGSAEASANAALQAVNRYPRINPDTMTWLVWDTAQGVFVDTGIVAEGKNGIEADGLWGVYVDDEGYLVVTYTGDDPPPLSISDDGYLVYTLNGQEIRVGKTVGPVGPVGPAGLGVPEATPEDADKIPIVAPDGTYKLGYQSGAIDDTKAQTDKTWSSLTIVDRLAPAFEASGPVVTCSPVEGYPLHVVSQIVPLQEGSGDPSPENVRPISGWDSATLTHNDTTITIQFGQTVYGGTLDWTTGVLTVTTKFFSLTGYERWEYVSTNNGIARYWCIGTGAHGTGTTYLICSQFKRIADSSVYEVGVYATGAATNGIINIHMDSEGYPDVESFKSFLRQKNAEGTPVEIVSQIGVPYTIQLTPQEIIALSGVNTIYTDTGDTTVSGRADPNAIIQQLAARIDALEGAATNL